MHADAARTLSVSPQGTVAQARQVVIKFGEPMVAFGSPGAADPARVQCSDAAAGEGQGRWIVEKICTYDFKSDLPPDVRCNVALNDGLESQAGNAVTGARHYSFSTGKPLGAAARVAWLPWPGKHRLELVDAKGQATDAASLEVRWAKALGDSARRVMSR